MHQGVIFYLKYNKRQLVIKRAGQMTGRGVCERFTSSNGGVGPTVGSASEKRFSSTSTEEKKWSV